MIFNMGRYVPLSFCVIAGITLSGAAPAPDFDTAVRPILDTHCFDCHNPEKRKSGLDLTTSATATTGGDSGLAAFAPHDPAGSSALTRIQSDDPEEQMPPKGDRLTEAEITTLQAWVQAGAARGAEDQSATALRSDHWSFQNPVQAPLPEVANTTWPRNPIDRFILHGLESIGLEPAARADKTKLLRRVYLDLVGLPPSPDEIATFLADTRDDAYERVVEQLLDSPHYGEKQAIAWLDIAHYADSNGYEKDRHRSIWPYRDWVIQALNDDLPYDTFVVKQLAGDLLQYATESDHVATGFLRNSLYNEEGGVDVEEFRFEAMVDRVNTVSTAMLGLTMNCAQCHTHKYDPITQREYYQFYAFLNNTENVETEIRDPNVTTARAAIQQKMDSIIADLPNRFPVDAPQTRDVALAPDKVENNSKAQATPLQDASILISGPAADKDTYTVHLPTTIKELQAVRVEALPHDTLNQYGPGRADNGNFVLSEIQVYAITGDGKERRLDLARAEADFEQKDYPVAQALDGKADTGWGIANEEGDTNVKRTATFYFTQTVKLATDEDLRVKLQCSNGNQHILGRFRITAVEQFYPESDVPDAERRTAYLAKQQAAWENEKRAQAKDWHIQDPLTFVSGKTATLKKLGDASILVMGEFPNVDTYTVTFRTDLKGITGMRLEALPHETLPGGGPGRGVIMSGDGDFFLSEVRLNAASWNGGEAPETIALEKPSASFAAEGKDIALTLDGQVDTGWSVNGKQGQAVYATFSFAEALPGYDGGTLLSLDLEHFFVHQHTLGRFRISLTTDQGEIVTTGLPADLEAALLLAKEDRSATQLSALKEQYLLIAPELSAAHNELTALAQQMPQYVRTLTLQERDTLRPTHFQHRGEFLSPKYEVTAGVPAVLHPFPEHEPRNRLSFARWIVAEENPLLARVQVNRQWQRIFGVGLVETAEDFGIMGTAPVNQELLDWLSVEFMRRGWSNKTLLRLMVTSTAYQQSADCSPEVLEKDPKNRLLTRGPRFRIEGELIRDVALASSGLLSRKMGGPSVYPPLSKDLMSLLYGGSNGKWPTSKGEDRYRRGIYTYMKRILPYPAMVVFDAPQRDTLCARRINSNTPLQALTVLNNSEFMVAAQALARRTLEFNSNSTKEQLDFAYQCVLGRQPDEEERRWLTEFLKEQETALADEPKQIKALIDDEVPDVAPARQAAWVALGRVLLNLDETLTKG